ncbi:MAG: FHA domain-containing protein [Planctomycetota bacterium JB042]
MKLTRVDADGAGQVLETDGESVVVGRKPARGLAVEHPTVSREHARLFRRDGDWNVADLNSSNGTFVNGRRVTRSELRPGDLLRLGSVELRLEGADAGAPPPPPSEVEPASTPKAAPSPAGEVEEIVLEEPTAGSLEPIPPAARRPRTDDPDRTIAMARRPTPRPPPSAASRPALSSAPLRSDRSGGVLGQDLSQQSFGKRLLYVLAALAVAYGLFTLTSKLTETVVPEGGLPEKIDSDED